MAGNNLQSGAAATAAEGYRPTARAVGDLLGLRGVPKHVLLLTAAASYGGQIVAGVAGWPLWAMVAATALPWVLVLGLETQWTYRHFHWLALFYVLVVSQGGHFLEHLIQMVQIHVLGLSGAAARGIFGQLDVEWVHFLWNSWILVAVALLLIPYRRNVWLWVALSAALWHEVEHAYIMTQYLGRGVEGSPGLLSQGGAIAGGVALKRPDLHFLYNLVETVPLVIAFVTALRTSYDAWLRRAFPNAPDGLLVAATDRLVALDLKPETEVVREGETADAFYIVVDGDLDVTRRGPDGTTCVLGTLTSGDYFGEVGLLSGRPRSATVTARTAVELLRLDRSTFERVVAGSSMDAEAIARTAESRTKAAPA